ncbi:hypothetical protein M3Y96_00485200 [Aphelenchoides besseyi]|nr:hypothetical protein M3Y96_00485200 [Aphelenchoides besseyi]
MLLISGLHRWHWAVGFVSVLVLSPIAVAADCFENTNDEVLLSGSCSKANATLFVKGSEPLLNFKLQAKKEATLTQQSITLAIGGCEFTGGVTYGGNDRDSIRFPGPPVSSPELPANAKADSNGISFNGGQNKVATCKPKFEKAEGGYKVAIKYDSKDVKLPDFKITFADAQLYVPASAVANWGFKGWRLWTVLGSVATGLVIVIAIITFVVVKVRKNKKKQLEAGGQAGNKSTGTKSSLKSNIKSIIKSKSAEKSAAKVGKNDWMKTFVWPLEYTPEAIDTMIVRFDVPISPAGQILQMHPMTEAQQDAFNRWAIRHEKDCALKNELSLTPELYNRLMAECRVIGNLVDAGKRMGLAYSVKME